MRWPWLGGLGIVALVGAGHIAAWRQEGSRPQVRLAQPAGMDATDKENFRGWFAFLAEAQFQRETKDLPEEIIDCAALVRFAYREALRRHDGRWAEELRLENVPPLGSVRGFVKPEGGWFHIGEGQFADFADAKTLMRENTVFISRELDRARPGDLLFYRQLDQHLPFHAMIFLGKHVVYHTGPNGRDPGEIRRPTLAEIEHHPAPQWRPLAGNQNFLGVYRWNILSE